MNPSLGGWPCRGRLVSEERSKALEESGFCFQDLCGKQALPLRQSSAPLNPLKIFLLNFLSDVEMLVTVTQKITMFLFLTINDEIYP